MANVDTDKMRMYVSNPSTEQMEPTGDLIRLMDHRLGEPNVSNDIGKVPAYVGSHYFEWQKRAIIATGTATAETSGTAAQNGYGRLDIPSSVLQHEGWLQIRYSYTPSQSFYFAFSGENGYSPLRYRGSILTADDAGIIRSGDLVTVFAEQVTIGNTTGFYFHLVGIDRWGSHKSILHNNIAGDGDFNVHDGYYFPNAVSDVDGNWYGAVIIGNQVWMAENLRVKHFSDGTDIDEGESDVSASTPYWYYPKGQEANIDTYGLLYNNPAVMNGAANSNANPSGVQGVSPTGWHIPSDAEWTELKEYLSGNNRYLSDGLTSSWIGKSMAAISGWPSSSTQHDVGNSQTDNNKSGFNAKPAGGMDASNNIVYYDGEGSAFFVSTSLYGSSTSIWKIGHNSKVLFNFGRNKSFAHSVRCVCDMEPDQFRAWYVSTYGSMQHHVMVGSGTGQNIRTVMGTSLPGIGNIDNVGVCDSAEYADALTASVDGFTLRDGAVATIRFNHGIKTNANSTYPKTLNINNTGNKSLTVWGSPNDFTYGNGWLVSDFIVASVVYLAGSLSYPEGYYLFATSIDIERIRNLYNTKLSTSAIKTINNQSLVGSGNIDIPSAVVLVTFININPGASGPTFGGMSYPRRSIVNYADGVTAQTVGFNTNYKNIPSYVLLINRDNNNDVSITIGNILYNNTALDVVVKSTNILNNNQIVLKSGYSMEFEYIVHESYSAKYGILKCNFGTF